MNSNLKRFNTFIIISDFARSLIEIFMSVYLYKNGFSLNYIVWFYIIESFLSIPISYLFINIGKKHNYIITMIIGIISFIALQILLIKPITCISYIILISFIYTLFRRGYWVSRRQYITSVMPKKESSSKYSIVLVLNQLAVIISSYIGSCLFDTFSITSVTIISSILLLISVIPLLKIKPLENKNNININNCLKKMNNSNIIVFSFFELNNLLRYIFSVYVVIYISNTYKLVGGLSIANNIAIILFILIYGKLINKDKNYLVLTTILLVISSLLKLFITNYLIVLVYFVDGIFYKLQTQSVNKMYFEDRGNIDIDSYNLSYQIIESISRTTVGLFLLLFNNIKSQLLFIILVMLIELIIYIILNKKEKSVL